MNFRNLVFLCVTLLTCRCSAFVERSEYYFLYLYIYCSQLSVTGVVHRVPLKSTCALLWVVIIVVFHVGHIQKVLFSCFFFFFFAKIFFFLLSLLFCHESTADLEILDRERWNFFQSSLFYANFLEKNFGLTLLSIKFFATCTTVHIYPWIWRKYKEIMTKSLFIIIIRKKFKFMLKSAFLQKVILHLFSFLFRRMAVRPLQWHWYLFMGFWN